MPKDMFSNLEEYLADVFEKQRTDTHNYFKLVEIATMLIMDECSPESIRRWVVELEARLNGFQGIDLFFPHTLCCHAPLKLYGSCFVCSKCNSSIVPETGMVVLSECCDVSILVEAYSSCCRMCGLSVSPDTGKVYEK